MAKARRTRPKRKRPRLARAASDDVVFAATDDAATRAILTDIRRLERHRDTELRRRMRDVHKLATSRKPANAQRLAQARRQLRDAQLECLDVVRLRRDIEGVIGFVRAQLAALEVEVLAGIDAAIVRYLNVTATRDESAELEMARTPLRGDFATELAKAKHATAIAIADRNKMRDVVALLTADSESAVEADEWRRELVVQEAAVAHLKEGLRLLVAKGPST